MPTHRDDEEERILESYRQDDDAELMEMLDEASRRRKTDDAFKLHFPVPKDRTMRRLAISQLILLVVAPASCVANAVLRDMSTIKSTQFGLHAHVDYSNPYAQVSLLFGTVAIISLIGLFIVTPIIYSSIMTRRYGWRAMQDPIEAHRVAVREGMADVLTADNRSDPDSQSAKRTLANRRVRPNNDRH